MGQNYRMKAETGRPLEPEPVPEVFEATVGALRRVLADLPADMPVRVSVMGSNVGVCQLAQVDCKDTELMLIGAKPSEAH